jgi:DNA transformation protein
MSEFVAYLVEVFSAFGEVRPRKMFGGYGLFHGGLMFGLVADDVLYLKADAQGAPRFVERGLEPFGYQKGDKRVTLSYYRAPEEIFDDHELAAAWAKDAFEAALRAQPAGARKVKP